MIVFVAVLLIAGAVLAPLFGRGNRRMRLTVALIFAALIAALAANAFDVAAWSGRSVYFALMAVAFIAAVTGLATISRPLLRLWFTIGVSLLVIETGFRAFPYHDTTAFNPGVKYFWPDLVNHPLNNFGYRDRDFVVPKPRGSYRVLLLGDSFTEGAGLAREQTFGRLIEHALKIEVYNLGHSGSNTREEADTLLRAGPRLDPDMVVLNYFLNDAETRPPEKPFQDVPSWGIRVQQDLVQRLGSYAAYSIWMSAAGFLPTNFPDIMALYRSEHAIEGKGWTNVVAAMSDIEHWAAARSVPVVAVFWPQLDDKYRANPLAEQVTSEMKRHGFHVVDLSLSYLAESSLDDLQISEKDHHPNARANVIAAGVIGDAIRTISGRDRR